MVDDKTLEQAGQFGRRLADQLTERVTHAIDSSPGDRATLEPKQKAAIARIVAAKLRDYAAQQAGEL
jgi:hypothetical protein